MTDLKFDPTGFERAAKALKEINESKYAKDALEVAKLAEAKGIKQEETKAAQAKAEAERVGLQRVKAEAEAKQRLLSTQVAQEKALAHYKARLDVQTAQEKENEVARLRQRGLIEEQALLRRNNEIKLEGERAILTERLKAAQKEAKVKAIVEKEKTREEFLGKIRQERENKDVRFEELKLKSDLEIKKIRSTLTHLGESIVSFFNSRRAQRQLALWSIGSLAALYSIKNSTSLARDVIRHKVTSPSLIREKSWRSYGRIRQLRSLPSLVFDQKHVERVSEVAQSLGQRQFVSLFAGPPGTGKSTLARQLALKSKRPFAICCGGDFLAAGKQGLKEINHLYRWAQGRKGLVLFIDEAEAFLKRGREDTGGLSEEARAALSGFLYLTGNPQGKVSVILATNVPEILDPAVLDRVEHHVTFSLPDVEARNQIFESSLYRLLFKANQSRGWRLFKRVRRPLVTSDEIAEVAALLASQTEGWSGRAIAQLSASIERILLRDKDDVDTKQALIAASQRALQLKGKVPQTPILKSSLLNV